MSNPYIFLLLKHTAHSKPIRGYNRQPMSDHLQPYITTLFRIRGQKPYIGNLVPFIHLFRRKRTCKMNFRQYRITTFPDKIPITGRTNHSQTAHRINFHNFFESIDTSHKAFLFRHTTDIKQYLLTCRQHHFFPKSHFLFL